MHRGYQIWSCSLARSCPLRPKQRLQNSVRTLTPFIYCELMSWPVRTLLDFFSAIPDSQSIQISTLTDNIAWAKQEKRVFLKHSLETRLVGLYVPLYTIVCDYRTDYMYGRQLDLQQHQSALTLIDNLLTELKRLDDKMILTEVHLLESRVYRGIGNFPKAKVSFCSIWVFSLMVIHLLGRSHILTNSCKLHLLSTCSPSFPWSSIRHPSCRR